MAFEIKSKRRLMELAGMDLGKLDNAERLDDEQPDGEPGPEQTEEHLSKETECFQKVHDALEHLLSFLHSQEDFEEKRGKEPEYAEMEHDASDLLQTMKKHLSGYKDDEQDSDAGLHGEMPTDDVEDEQEEQWGVHHTGENTNKSVEQLRHELAAAKRSGNTTRIRQKEFAIRAKTGFGKV